MARTIPDDSDEVTQQKQNFADYLRDVCSLKNVTASNYSDGLRAVSKLLKSKGLLQCDLYELCDFSQDNFNQLLGLNKTLIHDRDYIDMNERGNNMYSAGMSRFLQYYIEHLFQDQGKESGEAALNDALDFATHEHWNQLRKGLKHIADKYDIHPDSGILINSRTGSESTTKEEEPMDPKDIIHQVKSYIRQKGFTYPDGVIENLYLSLKAKPFVILAGISGTGKTRLARLFAEALGANGDNGRYKQVAVRPDWSDSSDLFGHLDLNGHFIAG